MVGLGIIIFSILQLEGKVNCIFIEYVIFDPTVLYQSGEKSFEMFQ